MFKKTPEAYDDPDDDDDDDAAGGDDGGEDAAMLMVNAVLSRFGGTVVPAISYRRSRAFQQNQQVTMKRRLPKH